MEIKAIETRYKGYRFRSRTEARWAIFFDTIGFKWEYEEEGFEDGDIRYLPDFLVTLPSGKQYYFDVKPEAFHFSDEPEKFDFYRKLTKARQIPLIILYGQPRYMAYDQISPDLDGNHMQAVFFQDYEPYIQIADSYWFAQFSPDINNGHFYFSHDERSAGKSFGKGYISAVNAARSARFEFGESGPK